MYVVGCGLSVVGKEDDERNFIAVRGVGVGFSRNPYFNKQHTTINQRQTIGESTIIRIGYKNL
jgi:hypothetical protein